MSVRTIHTHDRRTLCFNDQHTSTGDNHNLGPIERAVSPDEIIRVLTTVEDGVHHYLKRQGGFNSVACGISQFVLSVDAAALPVMVSCQVCRGHLDGWCAFCGEVAATHFSLDWDAELCDACEEAQEAALEEAGTAVGGEWTEEKVLRELFGGEG